MDKKKVIYIGLLLILTVIVSITYFSYAFFTSKYEQRGKLNIVTGTLDYKIGSADLTNNSITLEANKSKQIEIEITSLNNIDSKYELYYQTTASNIVVGYGSSNDTPTGTILANGKKTVKVVIKNKSNSPATIVFGVEGGFINNSLVLSTGNHITDIIDNICNYDTGYVWNFPFDPDGDGQGQSQSFTVPCDGNYRIELWGSEGGTYSNYLSGGAYTSGEISLNENNSLFVYVGRHGLDNSSTSYVFNYGYHNYSCNGGGSTDIRVTNGSWDNSTSINSRIMVAAGGGSSGGLNSYDGGNPYGGAAGGLTGYQGGSCISNKVTTHVGALGATQTSGHSFGIVPSRTTSNVNSMYNTGGGNGYYSGNYYNWTGVGGHSAVSGAGGGSSFISGHTGCVAIVSESSTTAKSGCTTGTTNIECSKHYSGLYFTNTKMIDGLGYIWTNVKGSYVGQPQPDGTIATGHAGNGHARITYLGE